jgi:hypothetical protein
LSREQVRHGRADRAATDDQHIICRTRHRELVASLARSVIAPVSAASSPRRGAHVAQPHHDGDAADHDRAEHEDASALRSTSRSHPNLTIFMGRDAGGGRACTPRGLVCVDSFRISDIFHKIFLRTKY